MSGDPEIYDAPIRLRKALANVPSLHTTLIDRDGLCGVGWVRIWSGPVDGARGAKPARAWTSLTHGA
jgi:hypothetical protein